MTNPLFLRLREHALSHEGAIEEFVPGWGSTTFRDARRKNFVIGSNPDDVPLRLSLKLTHDEASEALLLPFVRVADYVGRYGWVTASVTNDVELDIVLPWVTRSYELITGKHRRRAGRVGG